MKKQQVIQEDYFELNKLNKYGTLMTLGNGYMGVRGVHEEDYPGQKRGMFVAGLYNKATNDEPDEIVNLPDLVGITLEIDHEIFSLLKGKIISYQRELHLSRGEIIKHIIWEREDGVRFELSFQRMVAKHDLHVLASKITVKCINSDVRVRVVTGIDAQQTNFGRQHLIENNVRVYQEKFMQGIYETIHSELDVGLFASSKFSEDSNINFVSRNRQLQSQATVELKTNQPYTVEKYGVIFTENDADIDSLSQLEAKGIKKLQAVHEQGYDSLLYQSAMAWDEFWASCRIEITSNHYMDQLAVDFALYHIEIMTPKHNSNASIAAKGLTGEGYKGHIFWDTEIFILPFHLYTNPQIAKQLLQYRYKKLPQALEKARNNGYEGALYPWESARTGKEETPTYAAINIKTGERQKVGSALAEHHIVADVAYAVVQYYEVTNDDAFMLNEGLEILKETSRFWLSRTTEHDNVLFIENVIGPDEYTEFIDNNAFTNYMAYENVKQMLYFMDKFKAEDSQLQASGVDFLKRLYLPEENKDNVIPQDDTFFEKPFINLEKYKKNQGSQSILLDYSRKEVNEMQILKQADLVMLLYLFPNLFSSKTVYANFKYYEERTIHDSSLSKAIHAIVSMRCGEQALAYKLFQEACLIDLGPNPLSSDEGIHAASLGSIWLAVFSFINVSFEDEKIHINPLLPKEWSYFKFPIQYRGRKLEIEVDHHRLKVNNLTGRPITIEVKNKEFNLTDTVELDLDTYILID